MYLSINSSKPLFYWSWSRSRSKTDRLWNTVRICLHLSFFCYLLSLSLTIVKTVFYLYIHRQRSYIGWFFCHWSIYQYCSTPLYKPHVPFTFFTPENLKIFSHTWDTGQFGAFRMLKNLTLFVTLFTTKQIFQVDQRSVIRFIPY